MKATVSLSAGTRVGALAGGRVGCAGSAYAAADAANIEAKATAFNVVVIGRDRDGRNRIMISVLFGGGAYI